MGLNEDALTPINYEKKNAVVKISNVFLSNENKMNFRRSSENAIVVFLGNK